MRRYGASFTDGGATKALTARGALTATMDAQGDGAACAPTGRTGLHLLFLEPSPCAFDLALGACSGLGHPLLGPCRAQAIAVGAGLDDVCPEGQPVDNCCSQPGIAEGPSPFTWNWHMFVELDRAF